MVKKRQDHRSSDSIKSGPAKADPGKSDPGKSLPRPKLFRLTAVASLAAAVILLCFFFLFDAPELTEAEYSQRLANAKDALSIGEYALAEQFADSISSKSQHWRSARLVAGEAAFRDGRFEQAIDSFLQVAEDRSEDGLLARFSAAEVYRKQGDLENALDCYRQVYQADPQFQEVKPRIAFLLTITGQNWEAMPLLVDMIRDKSWSLESLGILADLERSIEQPDVVAQCLAHAPNSTLSRLAAASQCIADGNATEAVDILNQLIESEPDWVAAHRMLGEVLVAQDFDTFQKWNQRLPEAAENHPDVWLVRGLVARGLNQLPMAAGCFAKAVGLHPEHRRATYQLGQTLVALQHPDASLFVDRATKQMELSRMVDAVLKSGGRDFNAVRKVAELSEQLGRYLEAWAWASSAAEMFGPEPWSTELAQRTVSRLNSNTPRTLAAYRLTDQVDLSAYISSADPKSLMSISAKSLAANDSASSIPSLSAAKISFSANVLSPSFTYNNGPDPETRGVRMFEQTGGGVGIIDFDADQWPDLYFTQGNDWKTGENSPQQNPHFRDFLYRNLQGKKLAEVATLAGISNLSFSQGIAVGDYDGDGFQDLYVAAVGYNHLYRNNGDGTFTEETHRLEGRLDRWTTSCVLVDLNDDSLPEIVDVNYVQGSDVYTRICGGRGCSPKVFSGAPDQVFINNGDGRFSLLENAMPQAEAKGLGVLAARFGNDAQVSLFIANDQVPNFLLSPGRDSDGNLVFRDRALISGVAFNVDGLAMACMGIASEDLDGNGLLDFLVTNFADEPNSLYLQDAPGLFVDATRTSGLFDPSYPYVGWGTQFLDADLDGEPDLIVGNGHVDDYRDEGRLYQMPAQFFRNLGRGRFQQLTSQELGPFFQENYLSRGLAKLDWNRDGLFDFAVSNINQPAALVSNQSVGVGNYVNLILHGTESAREPIGSLVTLETEQKRWTKQLTAGDGYQASNERVLQFGLGTSQQIRSLIVNWPSGQSSQIDNVPVGITLHLIESQTHGYADSGQFFEIKVHASASGE